MVIRHFCGATLQADERPNMLAKSLLVSLAATGVMVLASGNAWAYIGPGAGLGLIGSLIAVATAILIALVGLFVLPFRMISKRRKAKASHNREVGAERTQGD